MTVFDWLSMLGGLALFLYGMNVMGSGLEKLAGGSLEKIFDRLTSNPFKQILLGAGVTALIQSSSAVTVLLIGFVNSGIMKLSQVIGIIMGSNIGTTITAWILSLSGIESDNVFMRLLKPETFSPVLALIGVGLIMFSKSEKKHHIANILTGFAILMFGMTAMGSAVEPLKTDPNFAKIILLFENPVLGVLAGAFMTAVIQSSSASVGILQTLSNQVNITFGSALPIILGQNIGTCVTALLSSVGANKSAKRVAIVHLYFNIIGTTLFLIVFYTLNNILNFTFMDSSISAFKIALVHTIFNVGTTIVLLPFSRLLEKLAYLTFKEDEQEKTKQSTFQLLDTRFLNNPSIALEKCHSLAQIMAKTAEHNVGLSIKTLKKFSEQTINEIGENEQLVDRYEDKLGNYLVTLSKSEMDIFDSQRCAMILHCMGDFERISDLSVNLSQSATEMNEKKIKFSKEAEKELDSLYGAVSDIVCSAVKGFCYNDIDSAYNTLALEEVIDNLRAKLKRHHVQRLQKEECTIELGFIYTDCLTNLERIADHCSNIAAFILQSKEPNEETHNVIHRYKTEGGAFERDVEKLSKKYAF